MNRPPHLLLVEAPYYAHIAALLRQGAQRAVAAAGATCEAVSVPGAFEIPAAIQYAVRSMHFFAGRKRFDGYVALGCVIRGETTHYDYVCSESARGLMNLAVEKGLAIGYGVLTVEDEAQAWARARLSEGDKGGFAARACMDMIALKRRLLGQGR